MPGAGLSHVGGDSRAAAVRLAWGPGDVPAPGLRVVVGLQSGSHKAPSLRS